MSKSETVLPEVIEVITKDINSNSNGNIPSLDRKVSIVFCKICHSGGSSEQLIQPCLCKGSIGNVHLSCLERWLNECSVDRCELCHFQFTADHTRRHTIWRSMVIWASHPAHRHILFSDMIVMTVMTVVVTCLVVCLIMGLQSLHKLERTSTTDMWGNFLIAGFITAAIIGYILSMYTIIRDNFRPWYRWWRNCNDIRLNREHLSLVSNNI